MGVLNKVADASLRIFVLIKISTIISGFEKLKTEYESCLDFCDIYTKLKDGTTHEIDVFSCTMDIYL